MPSFSYGSTPTVIDLGEYCMVKTRPNPADMQLTGYPGVNGLAALAMGSRGFRTEAIVGAVADSMAALGAIANTWYALVASEAGGTLVDSYGIAWTQVVPVDFYPLDEPGPVVTPGGTGYGQMFAIEFLHLI